MFAKLEALSGPLKGKVFALTAGETFLGREPSNEVSIPDGSISRRHCVVEKLATGFLLKDLGSRNSTLVDGAPVEERLLRGGEEIRVGRSCFLFSQKGALNVSESPSHTTVVLRSNEAIYMKLEEDTPLPATPRVVGDLKMLLRISQTVPPAKDLQALERQIVEAIFDVSPADRVAIVLSPELPGGTTSVLGWSRLAGPGQKIEVSQTIVGPVLEEGIAILRNDVLGNEEFGDAESLILRHVRSVLAVPLIVYEQVRGAIYLEAGDLKARFDEDLLQLMTAIGSIAAVGLENVRHLEWLAEENQRLRAQVNVEHNMVGDSLRIREVCSFIGRVAPKDSTVLISGESGTGKELVARAIHANSSRAGKPFVAINCAALTDTLLESELFGHEKGSFTGAIAQKKGKLEIAEGGTVFLDEIGEMAPLLQAKLLRVLQEREFERVGGTRTVKLNIRVIAATNRDLREEVRKSRFRQDLFFRLNVVAITMPALRERREDIPLLAAHFAAKYGVKLGRMVAGISRGTRTRLMTYDWPGNVRELENAIEHAVVLGTANLIQPEDLPEMVAEKSSLAQSAPSLNAGVRDAKKTIILRALEQTGGNHAEAAEILGVHANHLSRLITTLNLRLRKRAGADG